MIMTGDELDDRDDAAHLAQRILAFALVLAEELERYRRVTCRPQGVP